METNEQKLNKYRQEEIVFDKHWFLKHQSKLLWFLNAPIIKYWFRWCLRIRKYDCPAREKITNIQPNNFTFAERMILADYIVFKNGKRELLDLSKRTHKRLYKKSKIEKGFALQRTTDFRTHDKYSKRLYYIFKPFWYLLHAFDWALMDRVEALTKLSFGFSTLTVYPNNSGFAKNGWARRGGVSETWATIIAGAGNGSSNETGSANYFLLEADASTNKWNTVSRSLFLFNTSSLGSGATISAAIMSLYGNDKVDQLSCTPDINIYVTSPASDSTAQNGDYEAFGTTPQCDTAITYSDFDATDTKYTDFTFNATGRGNITKDGISHFGARNANKDVAGSSPTYSASKYSKMYGYYSNGSGASPCPKLVVTYSTVVGPANLKSYNTNLSANIKTINTNNISNVKSLNTNV